MISIRAAEEAEVPLILAFIRELAEYERLAHAVTATEADLRASLFGRERYARALFACDEAVAVGFAIYFFNYSTFLGRPGLYLEDLFVRPAARGRGVGRALLRHLAAVALEHGCGRFEWSVLDWNTPALDFYTKIGAARLDEWKVHRLDGPALDSVAARTQPLG